MPIIIKNKIPCKICSKYFLRKNARKKTCSKICSLENISQLRKKYVQNKQKENPNYFKEINIKWREKKLNREKTEIKCSFCERELPLSRKKRSNIKTCSKKCSLLSIRQRCREANNRNYQRKKIEKLWLEVINPELKRKLELKIAEEDLSITKILEKVLSDYLMEWA